jgi:hypothetical protein
MEIIKLQSKELDTLNEFRRRKIKGKYVIELPGGERLYGALTKKDLQKALKPQKVDAVYKFND